MSIPGVGVLVGHIASEQLTRYHREREADARASRAARAQLSLAEQVGSLQRQCEELRLYLASAIALLIRKNVLSGEEFSELTRVIDAAGGVVDGRFSGTIKPDGSLTAEPAAEDDLRLRQLAEVVRKMRP